MATPAAVLSLLVKADGIGKASTDLAALDKTASKASASMDKAGKSADAAGASHDELAKKTQAGRDAFDKVGRSAGFVALGVAGIGAAAVKASANYESSMNTLKAVSGATDQQMSQLSKTAVKLGADTKLPGTSAQDAAEAMTEMIKAGVSLKDTMGGVRSVLVLSAAAGISNARAAEIASNALNAFKLKGKDVAMVADQLANTANASSVEINDVADSFKMAAAVFAGFQKPTLGAKGAITELNVAIGILGNAGIKGSDAGTSLKQMLLQLTGPSNAAKEAMKALYVAAESNTESQTKLNTVIHGSSKERQKALDSLTKSNPALAKQGDIAYDAAGKMRSLKDIIALVAEGTKNMTAENRNAYLTQIFGADATRSVIALMDAGPAAFDKMTASVTKQGAAQDLADAKMKGFKGSLEALKSTMETLAINVGTKLLPALTKIAQTMSGIVGSLSPTAWTVLIGVIGAFAVSIWAVNAAMKAYVAVQTAGTAAMWLFNAALAANPIVLVIAALVALGVGLVIAYKKVDAFRAIVDDTFSWIRDHWPLLAIIMAGPIGLAAVAIIKYGGQIKDAIVGAFTKAVEAVKGMGSTIIGLGSWAVNRVVEGIHNGAEAIVGAGGWIVNRVAEGAHAIADTVEGLGGWLKFHLLTGLTAVKDGIVGLGGSIIGWIVDGLKAGANKVVDFLNDIIGIINKLPGVEIGKIGKFAQGGAYGPGGIPAKLAQGGAYGRTGGKVNTPITLMGEEAPRHPEFVIPTNPAYRKRAQGLISQAAGAIGLVSGGVYSKGDLTDLWKQAGGSGNTANLAAAVALAESSGRATASSPNPAGGINEGLWQIWSGNAGATFDPLGNARAAVRLSNNGTDWHLWEAFTNGKYKQFLGGGGGILGAIGGAIEKIGGIVGDLLSGGVDFLLKQLPSPDDLPAWLQGLGKHILGGVTGWLRDKVSSILGGLGGGGETSTTGLVPQVQRAVQWARAHGWGGSITSGFRSYSEQAALYARYLAGGPLAAKPGTSSHERGQAVDVTDPAGFARALTNAPANSKIYNRLGAIDPVHFSVSGYARGTSGARKGFALVGERGPELVSMASGQRVIPNNRVGGGNTVVVEHHYHGPVVQDRDFITYLRNLNQGFVNQNGKPAFGS